MAVEKYSPTDVAQILTRSKEPLRDGVEDRLRLGIRHLIADQLDTENGTTSLTRGALREVANNLSLTAFRNVGLLAEISLQYRGDIPAAIRDTFQDTPGKPLLYLSDANQGALLQADWLQRVDEIDEQIKERSHRYRREPLVGRGGEVIRKSFRNKKKAAKPIFMQEKTSIRKPLFEIQEEESRDEAKIFSTFINKGDVVVQLYGTGDITQLASMLDRVGDEGKIYYHGTVSNVRERVYEDFFKAFAYDPETIGEKAQLGRGGNLTEDFVSQIRATLLSSYVSDLEMYMNGYSAEDLAKLVSEFYSQIPLSLSTDRVLPFLSSLRSSSIDVMFEVDTFAQIPEDEKEEILWEVDRVLKPSGKVAIREHAREQTTIEYYGQDVFSEEYYRLAHPKGLVHPARWIILRKNPAENEDKAFSARGAIQKPQVREQPTTENSKISTKENLGIVLYEEMQKKSQEHSGDQSWNPSISWFRDNGLLQALVLEFGGNIQQAIAFATEQNKPKVVTNKRETVPSDAKSSYSVEDIAKVVGVPKSQVRKALSERGVITEQLNLPSKMRGRRSQVSSVLFSYEEYRVALDFLRLQQKTNKQNRGSNE